MNISVHSCIDNTWKQAVIKFSLCVLCTQYGGHQYVLSDGLLYLNMEVNWHWRYLMCAHSSMAASIDLSTLKVLGVCVFSRILFLLFTVANICRNTCINERNSSENGECSVLLIHTQYEMWNRPLPKLMIICGTVHVGVLAGGVRVYLCDHATCIGLTVILCIWNNWSLKKGLWTTVSAIGALLSTHKAQAHSPEHLLWSLFSLSCQDSNRCLT